MARPALSQFGNILGQPIDVENMGIEIVPEPFFAEPSFVCIEGVAGPVLIGIGRTPADIAHADLIERAVGQAQGRLDGEVQPVEPNVERHLDAA